MVSRTARWGALNISLCRLALSKFTHMSLPMPPSNFYSDAFPSGDVEVSLLDPTNFSHRIYIPTSQAISNSQNAFHHLQRDSVVHHSHGRDSTSSFHGKLCLAVSGHSLMIPTVKNDQHHIHIRHHDQVEHQRAWHGGLRPPSDVWRQTWIYLC